MKKVTCLTKKEKVFFTLYLLFFALVASLLALMQPNFNNPPFFSNPPDEHARILVPEFIARFGYLPTGLEEEVKIPGYGFSYALTPYLPFVFMGYIMRFVLMFTKSELLVIYTARLVNVCFGTIMASVVFFLSRRIFENKKYAWAFSIAVMFLPEHLFVHSYVNTESMCFLGISILLFGLVSIYQDGAGFKNSFVLSMGISIVISTYYNAYGYLISAFLLFIACFLSFSSIKNSSKKKLSIDFKNMFKYGFFIFAIVAVTSGWWFVRNYLNFDGDIFGMKIRDELFQATNPASWQSYRNSGYNLLQMFKLNPDYFPVTIKTFFAALGSVSIFCNDFYYVIYEIFYLIGLILAAVFGVSYLRKNNDDFSTRFKKVFLHINMIYCIIMPMVLHLYYVYTVEFQRQGRYLLPILLPLVFYVIKGYEGLGTHIYTKGSPTLKKIYGCIPFLIIAWVLIALIWMVFKVALPVYLADPIWNHVPPSPIFE